MTGMLANQVAIITGAGRGIGAAAAHLFAQQGAKVVVSDLDSGPAEETAAAIRSAGGEAIAIIGSVTREGFPEELVRQTVATYGKLNILVNNAGYTWDGVVHKMTDAQWQAILEVHLTAPFKLIRAAAPHMRDAAKQEMDAGQTPEPRCIINVSSTSGLHGNAGQVNYAAAKMGLVGLTKTIAKEWGRFGVRCNTVAFGFIDTRLTRSKEEGHSIDVDGQQVALGIPEAMREMAKILIPLGRHGTVEDAAGGILLMASPFAAYITGHTLEVTGGAGI